MRVWKFALVSVTFVNGCATGEVDDAVRFAMEHPVAEDTVLAHDQSQPCAVVAHSKGLYWSNRGTDYGTGSIMHLPRGRGEPITIAEYQDSPCELAVDDRGVSWATYRPVDAGNIYRAAPTGIYALSDGVDVVHGIASSGERIYWSNVVSSTVNGVDVVGGGTASIPVEGGGSGQVAYADDTLFWSAGARLMRGTPEGAIAPMWQGEVITDLAAQHGAVAWITETGDIWRASSDGGAIEHWYADDAQSGGAVALDEDRIYFSDANGTVRSLSRAGELRTIAEEQSRPRSLAVDELSVYWVDMDRGTVHAAPKTHETLP